MSIGTKLAPSPKREGYSLLAYNVLRDHRVQGAISEQAVYTLLPSEAKVAYAPKKLHKALDNGVARGIFMKTGKYKNARYRIATYSEWADKHYIWKQRNASYKRKKVKAKKVKAKKNRVLKAPDLTQNSLVRAIDVQLKLLGKEMDVLREKQASLRTMRRDAEKL